MKIYYKNVCSIRNAEVEFKPGKMICIRGESNQGKSALFYTMLAGFTNSPEFKRFINNDALKENPKALAWIGLEDDEGNLFEVGATTNSLFYKENKLKYEKVGRKCIFDMMSGKMSGLLYDPEDTRQIMNLQGEDDGLFPIDRSDSQIFKTYERLLSLSCTEDILRTIKLDAEDLDIKSSEHLRQIHQSQEQISKIDEILANEYLKELSTKINTTELLVNTFTKLQELYDKTEKTAKYIDEATKPNDFESVQFDVKGFEKLLNALVVAGNHVKYIQACAQEFPKQSFDIEYAIKLNKAYDEANASMQLITEFNKFVKQDEEELEGILSILNTIETCPYCGKPME